MEKKNKEVTIVPTDSIIFLGPKEEWKQKTQGSKCRVCNVALKTNTGKLEVKNLVWCDEKDLLYIPKSMIDSFNIDNYSGNYTIEVYPGVIPLTDERIKEKRKQQVNSATKMSLGRLLAMKRNNRKGLYAVEFEHGTNFQKALVKDRDCLASKHKLFHVVAILHNKAGKENRIGKIVYCADCRRAYLGNTVKTAIDYSNFPKYNFLDWNEYDSLGHIERMKLRYPMKVPSKLDRTVLIDDDKTIYYGNDLIHTQSKKHKVVECRIALLDNDGKKYIFYDAKFCPTCYKYYLPYSLSLKELRTNHARYHFEGSTGYKAQLEEYRKKKEELAKAEAKKIEEERKKKKEEAAKQKQLEEAMKNAISIKAEDFVVRTGSFSCRKNGHYYKEITAAITVIRPNKKFQEVYIPGWYCSDCKCYYIPENVYEEVDRMGVIVAKVYDEQEWRTGKTGRKDYSEWRTESLLHKMGYNVDARQGLSDSIRQDILATAVDFKIMSRTEMMDFLSLLIRSRLNDDRMQNAISKWETDRKFVSKYKLNTKNYVRVKSIKL